MLSAHGNALIQDWDGSKPMLSEPKTFPYLTGEGADGKPGYMERYAEARALETKLTALANDGQVEEVARLPRPNRKYLRDPKEVVLTHHPSFDNCPFRTLMARAVEYGYEYRAFPTREHAIEALCVSPSSDDSRWFVIVEFDCPLYLYFDFEEDDPSGCSEAEFFARCSLGLSFVLKCIEGLYGVDTRKFGAQRTYWFSACTASKNSFHAHVKIAFANISAVEALMAFVRRALDSAPELHPVAKALRSHKPSPKNPWILDFGVYNGHRNFRAAFQRKFGKTNGELIPYDGTKRLQVTSEMIKKWIKRTMILLPKNDRRAACLPAPTVAERMFDAIRQRCRDFQALPLSIECVEECLAFVQIAYFDGCDDFFEPLMPLTTEEFVSGSSDRRWLLVRAILWNLRPKLPGIAKCTETALRLLNSTPDPSEAWMTEIHCSSKAKLPFSPSKAVAELCWQSFAHDSAAWFETLFSEKEKPKERKRPAEKRPKLDAKKQKESWVGLVSIVACSPPDLSWPCDPGSRRKFVASLGLSNGYH